MLKAYFMCPKVIIHILNYYSGGLVHDIWFGRSASVISNYESGERTPSVEILVALARLYHCSTDYLLGFDRNDVRENINVSMLNDGQRELLQSFLLSLKKPE